MRSLPAAPDRAPRRRAGLAALPHPAPPRPSRCRLRPGRPASSTAPPADAVRHRQPHAPAHTSQPESTGPVPSAGTTGSKTTAPRSARTGARPPRPPCGAAIRQQMTPIPAQHKDASPAPPAQQPPVTPEPTPPRHASTRTPQTPNSIPPTCMSPGRLRSIASSVEDAQTSMICVRATARPARPPDAHIRQALSGQHRWLASVVALRDRAP